MEETDRLKGKDVKIFLKNGYKFEGRYLDREEEFFIIQDSKTGMRTYFNRAEIRQLEVRK